MVLIDTEGGLCFLHPDRLNAIDPICAPFPGTITNATLVGEHHLVATWVEREISLARLAAIDLREPFKAGVDLSELRVSSEFSNVDNHHVAGAVWSHILDAEPLALCSYEGDIVFCTHRRGVYRITPDSEEVWRQKPIEWSSMEDLPDGEVLVTIIPHQESLWAFSLGGGWAEIDPSDGSIKRRGANQFKSAVNQVWSDGNGSWLFGLSHSRIAWWSPNDPSIEVPKIEIAQGPIQDAKWHDGKWIITGWREDLTLEMDDNSDLISMTSAPRPEIGCQILLREEEGPWVLDNRGQWSPFGLS